MKKAPTLRLNAPFIERLHKMTSGLSFVLTLFYHTTLTISSMKKKSYTYKIAYYDENGKRRGKTFTAPSVKMARLKAAEWELNHRLHEKPSMCVVDALNSYIDSRAAVLSPSTVRSYRGIVRTCIDTQPIGKIPISSLTQTDIQAWINSYVGTLSPRTIIDHYSLLKAAITAQDRLFDFGLIILPQKDKKPRFTPSEAQIKALIEYTKKQERKDLYRAVLLCSFGLLRRSEVCAITSDDIHGNTISINKAIVKDDDGAWVTKQTKTTNSTRDIEYPQFVIDELKGIDGRIIPVNPDALSRRFERALRFAKLPHFGMHAMRRFGASILHALNVPDLYIRQRGGWSTDAVMKQIYINEIDEEKRKQTDKINAHFANL